MGIREMKRDITKKTAERNAIRNELDALKREQMARHKIAEARRSELEGEIRKLEKQNQILSTSIEKTQERANEALLVIIQLEFEIKTYENLLDTQHNLSSSRARIESGGSFRALEQRDEVIPEPAISAEAAPPVSSATSKKNLLESTPRSSLILNPSNNMRHTLA